MGYYLPRLPSVVWLTLGVIIITLLDLYTVQGAATVNAIALNMPAPFGPNPIGCNVSTGVCFGYVASPSGILIADLFLGIILGVSLKLVDAPLGTGQRYRSLERKLEKRPAVYNAPGLAAYIGRKKYGAQRFQQLSVKRRRR